MQLKFPHHVLPLPWTRSSVRRAAAVEQARAGNFLKAVRRGMARCDATQKLAQLLSYLTFLSRKLCERRERTRVLNLTDAGPVCRPPSPPYSIIRLDRSLDWPPLYSFRTAFAHVGDIEEHGGLGWAGRPRGTATAENVWLKRADYSRRKTKAGPKCNSLFARRDPEKY